MILHGNIDTPNEWVLAYRQRLLGINSSGDVKSRISGASGSGFGTRGFEMPVEVGRFQIKVQKTEVLAKLHVLTYKIGGFPKIGSPKS